MIPKCADCKTSLGDEFAGSFMAMGFEVSLAKRALKAAKHDTDAAFEMMLDGTVPPADEPPSSPSSSAGATVATVAASSSSSSSSTSSSSSSSSSAGAVVETSGGDVEVSIREGADEGGGGQGTLKRKRVAAGPLDRKEEGSAQKPKFSSKGAIGEVEVEVGVEVEGAGTNGKGKAGGQRSGEGEGEAEAEAEAEGGGRGGGGGAHEPESGGASIGKADRDAVADAAANDAEVIDLSSAMLPAEGNHGMLPADEQEEEDMLRRAIEASVAGA